MDNLQDIKRALVDTLSPEQKIHLDSVRWLFNMQRASGKTYLLCVEALLRVCEIGEAYLVDHYHTNFTADYVQRMVCEVAEKVGLIVEIRKVQGNVYKIRYVRSPEDYIYAPRRSPS